MWFVYTLLCIIVCTLYDICIAHYVKNSNQKFCIFKSKFIVTLVGFICILFYCLFTIKTTGFQPLLITFKNPIILVPLLVSVLYTLFFCLGLKYVGLSIAETVENTNGLIAIVGLAIINLISGSFSEIKTLLSPLKIILFLAITFLIIIFPNIELIFNKKSENKEKLIIDKKKMVIGIIILIISAIFDGVESIISSYCIEAGLFTPIEYVLNTYFYGIILGVAYYIFFVVKENKLFNPFKKENSLVLLGGLFCVVSALFYFLGLKENIVKSNLLMILYPIFPIILSRYIFKEKYNWKQWLCISLILIFTTVFVVIYNL